jgi:outer membrane protein insertion porin family
MKRTTICLIATILLLGLAPLKVSAQTTAPLISRVTVNPLLHLAPDITLQVNAMINKLVGKPFKRTLIDNTLDDLLDLGWFGGGDWTPTTETDGTAVAFELIENPVITGVKVIGNTVMTTEELLAVITTQPGTLLNVRQTRADALAIRRAYAEKGYKLVYITDISITPEGNLEFTIMEYRIGEVRFLGNERIGSAIIDKELTFKSGDVYNENALRASLQNLDQLGIFNAVTIEPSAGKTRGTIDLTVHLEE